MKTEEIHFKLIKELPIYAASGLTKLDDFFYVVADDENLLYRFNLKTTLFERIMVLETILPADPKERKKLKSDWESIAHFSEETGLNGLLAVPSGSKENRQKGFFISLTSKQAKPIDIDFSKIYQYLNKIFPDLNIEGSTIKGSNLVLLQRGNAKSNQNALIFLDLEKTISAIQTTQTLQSESILDISHYEIGSIENSPLSFTDAFSIDGFIFYLAVCEETQSTYEDGPFKGAVLGRINTNGKIDMNWKINCPFKPEGLWIEKLNGFYQIYLVTDADSREQHSGLYFGQLKA